MSFDIIIDWESYETDFKGHEVKMQLRPLKSWASILLTPIYMEMETRVKKIKAAKDEKRDISDIMTEDDIKFVYKIQEVAKKVFPDHVKDITGITMNGTPVNAQALCEETFFSYLCMDIIAELGKRTQLDSAEVKNLKGPSITQTNAGENIPAP